MTLEKMDTLKHFAINRFVNLYPTYWLGIIMTVTIITLFPVPTLGDYSLKEILMNFTMLQSFFHIRHIDQVYWTLRIQLLYYSIMAIVFYFHKLKNIEVISIIWLSFSVLTLFVDLTFEKYFKVLLILEQAPLFIAGMMFYKLKYSEHSYIHHLIVLLSLITYLSVNYYHIHSKFDEPKELHLLSVIIMFVVFYFVINFNMKILQHKFLIFLGAISYPLYLLHNVIGYSIIYRVKIYNDNVFVYSGIAILITVTLAYAVHRFMKYPNLLIKEKLLEKFN